MSRSAPSGGRRGRGRRGARPTSVPVWTPPWRKGLPERPKEDPAAPGAGAPVRLDGVLDGLVGAPGPWRAGLAVGELGRRWGEVVGEALVRRTAPRQLDAAGVLIVRAASAAWATQVRFLGAKVAANANQVLGRHAVREIRVVVDPTLGASGQEPPAGPAEAP